MMRSRSGGRPGRPRRRGRRGRTRRANGRWGRRSRPSKGRVRSGCRPRSCRVPFEQVGLDGCGRVVAGEAFGVEQACGAPGAQLGGG
ncbi:MAG: hypothetical protein GEU93_09895 [Propionibacteriales bacterium]|nr:hypothetical protein [Propionibacteriales bacterium]